MMLRFAVFSLALSFLSLPAFAGDIPASGSGIMLIYGVLMAGGLIAIAWFMMSLLREFMGRRVSQSHHDVRIQGVPRRKGSVKPRGSSNGAIVKSGV